MSGSNFGRCKVPYQLLLALGYSGHILAPDRDEQQTSKTSLQLHVRPPWSSLLMVVKMCRASGSAHNSFLPISFVRARVYASCYQPSLAMISRDIDEISYEICPMDVLDARLQYKASGHQPTAHARRQHFPVQMTDR